MNKELVVLSFGDRPDRTVYESCDIVIPNSVPPTKEGLLEFLNLLFEGKEKVRFDSCTFANLGDKYFDNRL